MYIVVLIAFIAANAMLEMNPFGGGGWRLVVPAIVAYLAGSVAIGSLRSALSLRALAGENGSMRTAMIRHNLLSMAVNVWLVAGLAALVAAGFGRWVEGALGRVPLAGRAVLIAPFVAAMIADWLLDYRFYRIAKTRAILQQRMMGIDVRGPWSLGEFIGYNLRHNFLFVAAPVGVIVLASDSIALLPIDPLVKMLSQTIAAIVGIVAAPVIIVRLWRTQAVPPGELADELTRVSRAMRLRYRRLLIWRTGGMISNAMVMGLLWPVRYVLLSDALIRQLSPKQVRAVFAHEAGHIVGHHLLYAMLFSMSSFILCATAGYGMASLAGLGDWWPDLLAFSLLGATWMLGFGWISRRFERQSDVVAAWFCGEPGPGPDGRISPEGAYAFASGLQRIAELNGMSQGQFNWRHGSIRWRINYIMWLGSTAGTRAGIDRVVRRIKIGLWAATAAATALVVLGFLQ